MQEHDKKVGQREELAGDSNEALDSQGKMDRALQLAQSSGAHRAAFNADPVMYLQNLGVDTRNLGPKKKLSLNKETLARLSGEVRQADGAPAPMPASFLCPSAITATCSMTLGCTDATGATATYTA